MSHEFAKYLEDASPMFKAWGDYVRSYVQSAFESIDHNQEIIQKYEGPRVKAVDLALTKIITKNYSDPFTQMTDLVGFRIVVLLTPDIIRVDEIIKNNTKWECRLDRDFEKEKADRPHVFEYQSNHYILSPKTDFEYDGTIVKKGICCEVQVRTLLQHAFAVTTHDSVYKSTVALPKGVERYMASSMALMETADHLMCETMKLINKEIEKNNGIYAAFLDCYGSSIGKTDDSVIDKKLNLFAIENLKDLLIEDADFDYSTLKNDITRLLADKSFIADNIHAHNKDSPHSFWKQPIALVAYYLCNKNPRTLNEKWPLAIFQEQLKVIYSELGQKYPN